METLQDKLALLFSFAKRIRRPLLLDGAMGSLLQQRGVRMHPQLWMSHANLSHPGKVIELHKAYINAGADIITTNTFRTNPVSLKNSQENISCKELVCRSVELAKEAIGDRQLLLAGSNPPAEDCYQIKRTISQKEIEANHTEHIESLMDSGCHFILNETQSHFDEISFIAKFCSKNAIPFVMSFFFTGELKLLSGENLFEVIKRIEEYHPLSVGLNCIQPKVFQKVYAKITKECNWGFYLNCGSSVINNDSITCGISPEEYTLEAEMYLKKNPSFIGACCGSSPKHTKALKKLLDENN